MSQMCEYHNAMLDESVAYGCIFCRSGSEDRIIRELKSSRPEMVCISPKRVRIRRQGEKELATLFPGYIFFRSSATVDFRTMLQRDEIYRLLQYPSGDWKLRGSDLLIAVFMFDLGGIVGLSKARFDGNGIRILSGPLKEYENSITKLDKRAKTAQVTIHFHGMELIMWFGFEIDDDNT